MVRRTLPLLCVAALLAIPRPSLADERLVVVDPPDNLVDALTTALSSWDIQVEAVEGPMPAPTMPGSSLAARDFANRHNASAVAWITVSDDGPALWTYDRSEDRVTVRELQSPPPFDEPTAAEVALSVKTLLRHSQVAPEEDRFGAGPSPTPDTPTGALRLETGLAVRHSRTGADENQLRIALGASTASDIAGQGFELAARLRAGPGLDVRADDLVGHFSDTSGSLEFRIDLAVLERLSLLPWAGTSLHFTRISGSIVSLGSRASASRINPTVDGGLLVRYRLHPRFELGLNLEGSWLPRRQRYLVRGTPVFRLPKGQIEAGIVLSVPLL